MKVPIIILILLLPLIGMAQKVNVRGEKMVSKIEILGCNFTTGALGLGDVYTFDYDASGNLTKVVIKSKIDEQWLTKTGNRIDRKFMYADGTEEKSIKYEYIFDKENHIVRKHYYEGVGDPLTTKEVWDFIYRNDDLNGRSIVDSVSYCFLYRDTQSGMKEYDYADGVTAPDTLKVRREENGLYYRVSYGANMPWSEIGNKAEYNTEVCDDTNLNLNYLLNGAPYTIAGDSQGPMEFLIPEWINAKSGFLLRKDAWEYIPIKDRKGNIVNIKEINQFNGKLRQIFIISYLD